jgi:hypothetical protein
MSLYDALCTNVFADIKLWFYSDNYEVQCCNTITTKSMKSLHDVQFKCFLQCAAQIRDCDSRGAPLRDYKPLFEGSSGEFNVIDRNYGLFEQLMKEACGGSAESLRVIDAFKDHLVDCFKKTV